ncbi:hypothetical protein R5M92_04290 [Halomonas sp. Bachu 37]|uniref:hypothetical protein n=1 Tax=Halomonas kashgarensis TaxID=3084920 RepID=UPI00321706F2
MTKNREQKDLPHAPLHDAIRDVVRENRFPALNQLGKRLGDNPQALGGVLKDVIKRQSELMSQPARAQQSQAHEEDEPPVVVTPAVETQGTPENPDISEHKAVRACRQRTIKPQPIRPGRAAIKEDLKAEMQRPLWLTAVDRYLDDACLQAFLRGNYPNPRSTKRK